MAELKTKKTEASVEKFISTVKDKNKREDCLTVLKLMKQATKSEPKLWGNCIIGFGDYHFVYESGREGDWFVIGFSPRKENLTLYFMSGLQDKMDLLKKLGKYKTGKGCLYIKSLTEVDTDILKQMMMTTVKNLKK